MAPMSYAPFDHRCLISKEAVREGIFATSGNTLQIFSVGESGDAASAVASSLGLEDDNAFNSNHCFPRGSPIL